MVASSESRPCWYSVMVRVRRRSISGAGVPVTVADDEVAEQVGAKPAAVGGAALSDAIGIQEHPVTGFQLLGAGGQAIVAARQRPVDTAVRVRVMPGQAQRRLWPAGEFL